MTTQRSSTSATPAQPAPAPADEDIADAIQAYRPSTAISAADLMALRRCVHKAAPTTVKHARAALLHGTQMVSWWRNQGDTTEVRRLFGARRLRRYAKEVLAAKKPGSRDAAKSYLGRVRTGFGSTGKSSPSPASADQSSADQAAPGQAAPGQASPSQTSPSQASPVRPASWSSAGLTAPVVRTLETFAPELIDAGRFERCADWVRDAVARTTPTTVKATRDLMAITTYLAAWADDLHRPIRDDVLLSQDTLNEFLDVLDGSDMPRSSLATHRSRLVTVQEAYLGERNAKPIDRPETSTHLVDDDELAELLRWAKNRRSNKMRIATEAVVLWPRALGATPREAVWAQPDDVQHDGNQVLVLLHGPNGADPRTVPVLERFAGDIVRLAKKAKQLELEFMAGGTAADRSKRVAAIAKQSTMNNFEVSLNLTALRRTWMLELATTVRFDEFLALSGVRTSAPIDWLIQAFAEIRSSSAASPTGAASPGASSSTSSSSTSSSSPSSSSPADASVPASALDVPGSAPDAPPGIEPSPSSSDALQRKAS